jgi:hypothetical protein
LIDTFRGFTMSDQPKSPAQPTRPQPASTTPPPETAKQALQQSMDRRW